MSIAVNQDDWPLVRLHYTGSMTMADVTAFQAAASTALDRGERFVVLAVDESTRGKPERGTAKAQMAWMWREHKRLRAHLAGMAMLVPPDQVASVRKRSAASARLAPFPQEIFGDQATAEVWLRDRLTTVDGTV